MEAKIKPEPLEIIKGTEKQKIVPFLWFDNKAEEAAGFYTSVFKNARVKTTTWYNDETANATGIPKGTVLTTVFQIEGMDIVALNGGPAFQITPAISFMVNCRTREKIDELWNRLSEDGQVMMEIGSYPYSERYGWVQDKYGVSWQLILRDESQIIAPCLMFSGEQGGKAEEAMNFYMSVFERSAVETIEKYEPGEEGPTGRVKYAAFSLNGQNFKVMDAGREVPFAFNPGISFAVNCTSQKEIDYYWDILTRGGDESAMQCGWLKDKYGVSWQIVPEKLGLWISDTESKNGRDVMNALMQMKKLDMNILESAYNGKGFNAEEASNDFEEIGANYEGAEKTYTKRNTLSPNEEF